MSGRKWSIEAEASQLAYFGVNRVFIFDRARSQIALSQLAFTWKRHLLNPHASSDVDTISETVEYAFEALSQFGPSAINLNGLTVNQVQGEHLAAVLRMTYPWRAETPGWIAALGIAKTALALVGVDYRSALIGLLEAGA